MTKPISHDTIVTAYRQLLPTLEEGAEKPREVSQDLWDAAQTMHADRVSLPQLSAWLKEADDRVVVSSVPVAATFFAGGSGQSPFHFRVSSALEGWGRTLANTVYLSASRVFGGAGKGDGMHQPEEDGALKKIAGRTMRDNKWSVGTFVDALRRA